jgi:hypothetical protein
MPFFRIYTMFPEQNLSMWVVDGPKKAKVVITVGYSIINRSATVEVRRRELDQFPNP